MSLRAYPRNCKQRSLIRGNALAHVDSAQTARHHVQAKPHKQCTTGFMLDSFCSLYSVYLTLPEAFLCAKTHQSIQDAMHPGQGMSSSEEMAQTSASAYRSILEQQAVDAMNDGAFDLVYLALSKYWCARGDFNHIADAWRMFSSSAGCLHALISECDTLMDLLGSYRSNVVLRRQLKRIVLERMLVRFEEMLSRDYILNPACLSFEGTRRRIEWLLKQLIVARGMPSVKGDFPEYLTLCLGEIRDHLQVLKRDVSYFVHACCPQVMTELDSVASRLRRQASSRKSKQTAVENAGDNSKLTTARRGSVLAQAQVAGRRKSQIMRSS